MMVRRAPGSSIRGGDIVGFEERSDTVGPALALPRNLVDAVRLEGDERRRDWLISLPGVIEQLEQRWSLSVGEPFQPGGQTAWVAPAHSKSESELVLKLAWRHREAEHEADALRAWNGDGAVLLHASEALDGTIALLLERCAPGSTLASRPEHRTGHRDRLAAAAALARAAARAPIPAATADVRGVGRRIRSEGRWSIGEP